jgi:DNA-binding GntR family transcriptional regulator
MFQRAAKNIDNAGAQILTESAAKMSASAAKGNRDGWIAQDKIFHETVMRAASNEMIAEVSRVTRQRIQRFWARSVSGARDLVTCSDEHTEIAEAIIGKDMVAIRKSVEGHLGHLRLNMHEIVQSMAPFFGTQG